MSHTTRISKSTASESSWKYRLTDSELVDRGATTQTTLDKPNQTARSNLREHEWKDTYRISRNHSGYPFAVFANVVEVVDVLAPVED